MTAAKLMLAAAFAWASTDSAFACGTGSCGGASGGVALPAPAGVALFALGITLLLTRRRNA